MQSHFIIIEANSESLRFSNALLARAAIFPFASKRVDVCVCASRLNKSIHMQAKTQPKWFFVQVLSPREFKPRKFLIRTCGTKLSTSLLLALYLHSPLDVLEVTTRQVLFRTEKVSLNVFGLSFWKEPLLHDGRKVHWFSHTQSK